QGAGQAGLAAAALVEGRPGEADAAGRRPVVRPRGDLPLGPVRQPVGDAGRPAAPAAGVPRAGQVRLAVERAAGVAGGVAEAGGGGAVVHLAGGPAVPAPDAGGLVRLPGAAAVVGRAGAGVPGVVPGDELLRAAAE